MRIFLTGATGYIGSEVAAGLVKAGHEVLGLTHSPGKAGALKALGAKAVVGDLKEPKSWRAQAESSQALVHCGFDMGPKAAETDRAGLEALADACRKGGESRYLLYTSGVWVLGPKGASPADESSPLKPAPIVAWRPDHERLALELPRSAVLRPGCVYGGAGGLYGMMIRSAIETRKVRLVGSGKNCWAAVYLGDLAELYRLMIERQASGVFHATDDSPEPVRAAAEALLDAAGGGSLEETALADARAAMGPLADALAMDQRVSSERARRELGWRTTLGPPSKHALGLLKQWRERIGPASVA